MTAHGTHVPGRGWYDASLKGYVDNPSRLTRSSSTAAASRPNPMAGVEFRTHVDESPQEVQERKAAELLAHQANTWRPNGQMEELRALRTSNPGAFAQIARGVNRIRVGSYEEGLRAHLATGGELPGGVQQPSAPSA